MRVSRRIIGAYIPTSVSFRVASWRCTWTGK